MATPPNDILVSFNPDDMIAAIKSEVDGLRAENARLREALDAFTWQPIASAPRFTGIPVALWAPIWRQPFVGIVMSDAMGTNCYIDGKDGAGMHVHATHWMPLPTTLEIR